MFAAFNHGAAAFPWRRDTSENRIAARKLLVEVYRGRRQAQFFRRLDGQSTVGHTAEKLRLTPSNRDDHHFGNGCNFDSSVAKTCEPVHGTKTASRA